MPTLSSSAARIDAERCLPQQRRRDENVHVLNLTSSDQFDKRRKNFESPNKENVFIPKKKFEWNNLWKKKDRSNDQREGVTSIDADLDADTSMNTTIDDDAVEEGTEIEEIAEDDLEKEREKKKKKRQNVVVAAVATTSVSSLGVALAIILL